MKFTSQLCVLLLITGGVALRAADQKTEEAAIRAAIASERSNLADDAIFWSGAYKRPVIRPEKGEEFPGHDASRRINSKSTTDVLRIEVAASGDMAYEFSSGSLEYDLAGSPVKHVAFKTASLRVWKKVNGEWKVAAFFARPLDLPFDQTAVTTTKD